MPALDVQNPGMAAVERFGALLNELLAEAARSKEAAEIEPALTKADLDGISKRVAAAVARPNSESSVDEAESHAGASISQQFAVIETAARDVFDQLIVRAIAIPFYLVGFANCHRR